MLYFTCSDLHPGCTTEFRGLDTNDLLHRVCCHALLAHQVNLCQTFKTLVKAMMIRQPIQVGPRASIPRQYVPRPTPVLDLASALAMAV